MKKLLTPFMVLGLFSLIISPVPTEAASYKLSDGSSFEGTAEEYKYAEFILDLEEDLPAVLDEAWKKASKKTKFPSVDKLIAKAQVSGSATYDKKTKVFTITNTKAGQVTIPVKHGLSEAKVEKLVNAFIKELEVSVNKYEKKAGVTEPKNIDEDSDLYAIIDDHYKIYYDIGSNLVYGFKILAIDIEGTTNKLGEEPMTIYTTLGKNYPLDVEDRSANYFDLSNKFYERIYMEHEELPLDTINVNFEVDSAATSGTVITFKVKDIRGFSKHSAEEIWGDLFQ